MMMAMLFELLIRHLRDGFVAKHVEVFVLPNHVREVVGAHVHVQMMRRRTTRCYSRRSATSGSTRVARLAGRYVARKAIAASTSVTPT